MLNISMQDQGNFQVFRPVFADFLQYSLYIEFTSEIVADDKNLLVRKPNIYRLLDSRDDLIQINTSTTLEIEYKYFVSNWIVELLVHLWSVISHLNKWIWKIHCMQIVLRHELLFIFYKFQKLKKSSLCDSKSTDIFRLVYNLVVKIIEKPNSFGLQLIFVHPNI